MTLKKFIWSPWTNAALIIPAGCCDQTTCKLRWCQVHVWRKYRDSFYAWYFVWLSIFADLWGSNISMVYPVDRGHFGHGGIWDLVAAVVDSVRRWLTYRGLPRRSDDGVWWSGGASFEGSCGRRMRNRVADESMGDGPAFAPVLQGCPAM